MYQYSLNYYTDLFISSINRAEKAQEIQKRLTNLQDYFVYSLYCNVCRGLFEKDKLLFSFLLTIRLMEYRHELDHNELKFLLTGTIPLPLMKNIYPLHESIDFLPAKSVSEFQMLAQVSDFMSLSNELEQFVAEWKVIFDSNSPEDHIVPSSVSRKYNGFQKLCILRALRPDKVVFAIEHFIKREMGIKFL
jgi:dynein heavy chain, axonemal